MNKFNELLLRYSFIIFFLFTKRITYTSIELQFPLKTKKILWYSNSLSKNKNISFFIYFSFKDIDNAQIREVKTRIFFSTSTFTYFFVEKLIILILYFTYFFFKKK